MKIKKAKGVQHSVEGYVCACLMAGCSCSSNCQCMSSDRYAGTYSGNQGSYHSTTDSVQNGLER